METHWSVLLTLPCATQPPIYPSPDGGGGGGGRVLPPVRLALALSVHVRPQAAGTCKGRAGVGAACVGDAKAMPQVEAKMEALWLRKQEERLVDAAEAKAVHCKLQSWATGRARREAELSRKIEASRFGVHGASFFAETSVLPAAAAPFGPDLRACAASPASAAGGRAPTPPPRLPRSPPASRIRQQRPLADAKSKNAHARRPPMAGRAHVSRPGLSAKISLSVTTYPKQRFPAGLMDATDC